MERKWRSIVKAITWRIIGTMVLAGVSYLITGSIKHMTMITILFECIQLVNYYWHERVWMKVKWGRIIHPLQELPVKRKLSPQHMQIIRDQLDSWGYLEETRKEDNKKVEVKKKRSTRRVKPKLAPLGVQLKKETVG